MKTAMTASPECPTCCYADECSAATPTIRDQLGANQATEAASEA